MITDTRLQIRPFKADDEKAVVVLWQQCDLVRPWNNPHRDIQRKLLVRPELFLVGVLDGHERWQLNRRIATFWAARMGLTCVALRLHWLRDRNSQNRDLRSMARRLARPPSESARPSKARTACEGKRRRCCAGWPRCFRVANQLRTRLPGVFQAAKARADYSPGGRRQANPSQGHQDGPCGWHAVFR